MAAAAPSWLADRATEELKALEAQQPHRFAHLKLELKALISESSLLEPSTSSGPPPHICTQASSSSSCRKRKQQQQREDGVAVPERRRWHQRRRSRRSGSSCSMEGRAEVAIRNARDCLRRIREVKRSFFPDRLEALKPS